MRVAAAVTTYGRLASLQRCIACIRAQSRPADEIIVLDDHSPDATAAWLAGQTGLVTLIKERNGGPSQSLHDVLGAALSRGHDWVWVMDDDVHAAPDALARLLAAAAHVAQSGERVGAIKAFERQWDLGRPVRPPFALPRTLGEALRHRYMCPLPQPVVVGSTSPVPIALLTLAGTLLSRVALAEVGLPDPAFFYYGEDSDLGFRLRAAGFAVRLAPDAVVAHLGSGWRARRLLAPSANWRYYYMYRNQWVLARRHRGLIGHVRSVACRLRILAGCVHRVWIEARRGNVGATRMAARGLLDGLLGRLGGRVPLPGPGAPPHGPGLTSPRRSPPR
jgi:GT2 family glycosyltransferase